MKTLNDASKTTELAIFECGKEECVKNKAISLSKKPYHLFHYVISGKGTLILNKKEYQISKGTIFFIPKESDAIYFPDKENPWVYEWVGFDGSKVNDFLEYIQTDIHRPLIKDPQKNYKPYFDKIVQRYVSNGYIDMHALGSLYQLFGEMFYEIEGKESISTVKVTIQLAKDFIYNNYQFEIGIEDIARNANVTANYLSIIFKREELMSTKSYLTKVRMEKALALLQSGKLQIKDVSEMVGYSNQLHFSKAFKKYYGQSPINYLKKENTNEN